MSDCALDLDDDCGCVWWSGDAECAVCGHGWVATWPECVVRLECPNCGHMTTAPVEAWTGDAKDYD